MKGLSAAEVDEIARLARLRLGDGERDRLCAELSSILEHMDALAAVDVDGIEAMTHPVPTPLRLRADETEASLPAEVAVGAAPDRDGDQFRVPGILSAEASGGG